ncbi:MAG: OpgC domain-containing protein [Acidimicrobiales bacterium]
MTASVNRSGRTEQLGLDHVVMQRDDRLSGRDPAIDRLRGLCLVSMTFGHLTVSGRGSSVVNRVLHAPGWVSGAAGFVFLSGVSVGLLWRSKGGFGPAVKQWTIMRAIVLAMVHLLLNIGVIAWSEVVHDTWWVPAIRPSLADLALGAWMIPFGDVLPMYVVFLLAAVVLGPWVGRWSRLVLAGSAAVYLLGLALPSFGPMRTPGDVRWDLFTWQLIFVAGLVGGTQWPTVRRTIEDRRALVIAAGLASLGAIVVLHTVFALAERGASWSRPGWRETFESAWLDKVSMQPGRLLLVFTLGPFVYWVCTRRLPFDQWLQRAGSRSLRVYTLSTLACLVPPLAGALPTTPIGNDTLVAVLTIATLASAVPATRWRGRPWSF